MFWEDTSRSMLPVIRVGHQTRFYRRTQDYTSCSVRPAILAALLPASKLVSRLSQARERSSVPKLTSLLIDTGFCNVFWGDVTGQVYNRSGFTIVLKNKIVKDTKIFGFWLVGLWNPCKMQILKLSHTFAHWIYFTNCQRNVMGKEVLFNPFIDFCKMQDKLKLL